MGSETPRPFQHCPLLPQKRFIWFLCQDAHWNVLVRSSNRNFEMRPTDRAHSPIKKIKTTYFGKYWDLLQKKGWFLKMFVYLFFYIFLHYNLAVDFTIFQTCLQNKLLHYKSSDWLLKCQTWRWSFLQISFLVLAVHLTKWKVQ